MIRLFTRRGGLIVSLAAILGLGGCTSQHADPPSAPAVPVSVARVAKKNVPLAIEAIGSVAANRFIAFQSWVSGRSRKEVASPAAVSGTSVTAD